MLTSLVSPGDRSVRLDGWNTACMDELEEVIQSITGSVSLPSLVTFTT